MSVSERHVDTWVSEGIISLDQARSIRDYERQVAPSRGTAAEALSYIGGALVASAVFAVAADNWATLSRASKVSVLVTIAISLVITGEVMARDESAVTSRFARVTLMLSVAIIGMTAGVAAGVWFETPTSVVLGSAAAWAAAVVMYRQWQSIPQHLALFLTTLSLALSVSIRPFDRVPDALPGAVGFLVAVAWLILAGRSKTRPRLIGEILGSVTAFVSSVVLVMSFESYVAVAVVAFAALSVFAVAFGVTRRRTALTVVGIAGLIFHLPVLISEVFGVTPGAPVSLLAIGAGLAYAATLSTRRRS